LEALKTYDLAIMVLSFALAAALPLWVGGVVSLPDFFSMRVRVVNFVIFGGLLLVWHSLFSALGLYDSRRLSRRWSETWDVIKATAVGTFVLAVAALLFRIHMASLPVVAIFFVFSTGLLVSSRLVLRKLLTTARLLGRNLRNVLIVGTNRRAIEFAEKLETREELGYRILGFADREWGGSEQFCQSGRPFACELDNLPDFLRRNVVDEVAIALPIRSFHRDASRVAALCEQQGIILRVLPNIFDLKLARATAEELEGYPSIAHYTGAFEGWPVVAKRVLDLCLALIALIMVSPVMLLAAVLIKITSPGPVLFTQKRIGQSKRKFTIYKFRTMAVNAEAKMRQLEHLNEVSGPVFKIKNDPRITPVGRFLRNTSIDELPQLINVLKGDMSLVGPRPLPIRDYEAFSQDWHRRRFSVRPGMTCLWQVNGRSSLPFEKWMELDMQYIDKWSLWLDLKILAQTVPAVLKGLGAA
jgi:exopolysaccharide biosynthesis polyprenyl glycosylphosphotransferase